MRYLIIFDNQIIKDNSSIIFDSRSLQVFKKRLNQIFLQMYW